MKKKIDTNKKYHSATGISASGLKVIFNQSIFHYLNQDFKTSTIAMNFGSAVHSIMLGDTAEEIVIMPEYLLTPLGNRSIKETEKGNIFYKKNKNKIIITPKEHNAIEQIMEVLEKKPIAKKLIKDLTEVEQSYYGEHEDVPIKIRPDGLKKNKYIIDIKTTLDSTPVSFRRDIYNYAYHLQAVFYSDMLGYQAEEFKFIVVENKAPYNIEVYSMTEELIDRGRKAWKLAFQEYKTFFKTGAINGCHWEDKNKSGIIVL